MRFQQLDSTNVNTGIKVLRSLAFRADGVSTTRTAWVPRTVDVTILMAEAVPIPSATANFANNYLKPPTTVFTTKNVNLPDWTQAPAGVPAPFDLKFTFDMPWIYFGQSNFLWEIQSDNLSSLTAYGNDHQTEVGTGPRTDPGKALGTGCIVGSNTLGFRLNQTVTNHGTKFSLSTSISRGPASSPALLFLDYQNRNTTVPGLCSPVFAMPTVVLPLGVTTATGTLGPMLTDNIPFDAQLVGANLFFQVLAVQLSVPGFPITLTNGNDNTIPPTPGPQQIARIYEYSLGTSMRAPSIWTGSLVTQYEH
jgi:hypothetical protein